MADHMSELESQEALSKEMAEVAAAYDAAGVEETQPRRDYPPYRSSQLRHPTKDLQQADPEGVELWAPVFGARDVGALESDLTIQDGGDPMGERMVVTGRVLDGDGLSDFRRDGVGIHAALRAAL